MAVATDGLLPLVSPLSGEDAERYWSLRYRLEGLGFAWILLVLGPIGWAVLIVIMRLKGGVTIQVPFSPAEGRRIDWLTDARTRGAWGAVGFGAVALAARSAGPVAALFGGAALLCVIAAIYSLIVLPWIRPSINVDLLGRKVQFLGVCEGFAEAVRSRAS
ncbi:MAG: hypothetical protein V3V01_06060 [Acidimicrobiales bacterium]